MKINQTKQKFSRTLHDEWVGGSVLTSVVGGGGAGDQALSAKGRPGLDPRLPICAVLAVSVMATGPLLEVVPAHLWIL
jgi:hypothetical protein